jgi:hypothetical protein
MGHQPLPDEAEADAQDSFIQVRPLLTQSFQVFQHEAMRVAMPTALPAALPVASLGPGGFLILEAGARLPSQFFERIVKLAAPGRRSDRDLEAIHTGNDPLALAIDFGRYVGEFDR